MASVCTHVCFPCVIFILQLQVNPPTLPLPTFQLVPAFDSRPISSSLPIRSVYFVIFFPRAGYMSIVLHVEIKREWDPAGLSIHLQSAALLPHLPSSPPSLSLSLSLTHTHTHTPTHHLPVFCFTTLPLPAHSPLSLSLLLPLSFPLRHPLSSSLLLLLLSSSLSLIRAQLHSFTCAEAQHWQWFSLVSNLQLVRTEGLEPCQQRCYGTVSKQSVTPFCLPQQ